MTGLRRSNLLASIFLRPAFHRTARSILFWLPLIILNFQFQSWTLAADSIWKTGDEMWVQLQSTVGIRRSAQPVRESLMSLAKSQQVACWLDRRIDPDQEFELIVQDSPLQAVFQYVARRAKAEAGYIGPVVYIGPVGTASKLWTISELRSEEAQKLPAELRSKWSTAAPVHWPELSEPRALLLAAANEGGCTIAGVESLPHDLWPAADLPPLNLAQRLTLILAGFDRTFVVDGAKRRLELVPLPDNPQLERQHTPRGDVARAIAELSRNFPNAELKRSGSKLIVRGSAEDHDAIRRLLRGERVRRGTPKEELVRFKLAVKNELLGAVLRAIESQAKLTITLDEKATAKLRDRVSFEVSDASLEQLLEAALKGTGLTFQLQGNQLRIEGGP